MLKNWKWWSLAISIITVFCAVFAPDLWAGFVAIGSGLAAILFRRATTGGGKTASDIARRTEATTSRNLEAVQVRIGSAEKRVERIGQAIDAGNQRTQDRLETVIGATNRAIEQLERGADGASKGSGSGAKQ